MYVGMQMMSCMMSHEVHVLQLHMVPHITQTQMRADTQKQLCANKT